MVKFLVMVAGFLVGVVNSQLNFLQEVFSGKTGDVLDNTYKEINEAVQNVQNIGEFVINNTGRDVNDIGIEVSEKYGIVLESGDIQNILDNKGLGKYQLAFKIIEKRLIEDGKKYTEQAINLGIELAVNRFFGK